MLAVGGHSIAAIYSGDTDHTGSTGSLQQTVNTASSGEEVYLTGGSNPSTYGAPVTFTALISGEYGQVAHRSAGARPRVVTGTITWSANTGCGTTPLTSGDASCTTSVLPGGSDTVTVTYNGDSNHSGNTSSLGQRVTLQTPTVALTSVSPASEGYGAGTSRGGDGHAGLDRQRRRAHGQSYVPIHRGRQLSRESRAVTPQARPSPAPRVSLPRRLTRQARIQSRRVMRATAITIQPAVLQANNFSITQTKITPTVTMTGVLPNAEAVRRVCGDRHYCDH